LQTHKFRKNHNVSSRGNKKHALSSHAHGSLSLAAAVSACADQQFGTNFHRICEAQTLGTSLNVGLRAGYLSVHTAGGVSDRH